MGKSTRGATILLERDELLIPTHLTGLGAFRRWARSSAFPETGRIDWIGGHLEVDLLPEELNSHATPKAALVRDLSNFIEATDLGVVLTDSMRVTSVPADLSVEPDVVVLLFESIARGFVRLVRSPQDRDRCVEVQGIPDLVIECVSPSSVAKDRIRLRERYAAAGIPEYWIVDARVAPPAMTVLRRSGRGFREVKMDRRGYLASLVLNRRVRLDRRPERLGVVRYRLLIEG